MKKLILFLAMVSLVTISQAQCTYSFQFGYTNYMTKGQTNLNGFRAAFWPREYRYSYFNRSNSLASMGRQQRCYDNNNNIGVFGDFVFTTPNDNKAEEYQAVVLGFIMPIFPPAFNVYLGFGNKWNNGLEDEFVSEFISTYGITFISPQRGISLSIGRQTGAREMFARTGANTTIGIGYTIRR